MTNQSNREVSKRLQSILQAEIIGLHVIDDTIRRRIADGGGQHEQCDGAQSSPPQT